MAQSDIDQQYKHFRLTLPDGTPAAGHRVLLHSCCAPCSAAIVECMLRNEMHPTVFFSNSNIYPEGEYQVRRREIERFLKVQGVPFVEDHYDHSAWRLSVSGLEDSPERGPRCTACFRFRLLRAAQWGAAHGFTLLTTTLASSRWKDLDQINSAGLWATAQVEGITFWPQNWRKGGLQPRRAQLIRENRFYNQNYCGCEFSLEARLKQERARQQELLSKPEES